MLTFVLVDLDGLVEKGQKINFLLGRYSHVDFITVTAL